jgi:hypothetical protein
MRLQQQALFDIGEVITIVAACGMPATRVKNWTLGKPLKIEGSIKTGSRTLYVIEDIYRLGLAYEFRKSGMAVKPIGKLLDQLSKPLGNFEVLTLWRQSESSRFEVMEGKNTPPNDILTWQIINVAGLRKRLDAATSSLLSTRKRDSD